MTIQDILSLVGTVLINIPAIISLYFLWKKSKTETKTGDVNVALAYQKMAYDAAEKNKERDIRIEDLQKKVDKIEDLERMVNKLSSELAEEKKARIDAENRAILYENWSVRLVVQISKANMTPVGLHEEMKE